MTAEQIPGIIEEVFANNSAPKAILEALLPPLCEVLQCDRCFIYLRNPLTKMGKTPFCYRRNPDCPDVTTYEWVREPDDLPNEDPLFAAALRTDPSVYVEDVETASPDVVNVKFERENFGHRALIHAHLCEDGMMWGVLQPCLFGQPRVWTESDRAIISYLEKRIAPLVVAYVKSAGV